ncbi:Uncharacterized protein HZ326_23422 [Fusarium oxysporum f. sp. albedinis]|nr:Uncharacterized protein HZ326_23422 [Fusarium oxysporum f. sp. albedinis]
MIFYRCPGFLHAGQRQNTHRVHQNTSVGWYIEYFPSFETNKSDQQLTFKPKAELQTSSPLFMRIHTSLGINIIRH